MSTGTGPGRATVRTLLPCLILLVSLGFAALGTLGRALNLDEVADLHMAWLVHEGRLPWRDFLHNHPDVHLLALSPLYATGPADWVTYRLGKGVAILYGLGAVLTAMAWAHGLAGSREAALWAGALMASHDAFSYNLMEVRGELAGTALLCLCWRALAAGRSATAGIWLGLAACQNQKIGFFLPFVLAAAAIEAPSGQRLRPATRAALGLTLAPALLVLAATALGVLGPFLRWNVGLALDLAPTVEPRRNLTLWRDLVVLSPALPVLALAGLAVLKRAGRPWRGAGIAALGAILYAAASPYPNAYNLGHAVAALSVLCGAWLAAVRPGALGPASRIAGAALGLLWLGFYHGLASGIERWRWWQGGEAAAQWQAVGAAGRLVPPDALLLDGTGALARHSPSPFVELTANLTRLARRDPGLLPDVRATLIRTGARFVALDDGVLALPEDTVRFIERSYLPVCGALRCRGIAVVPPRTAGAECSIEIGVPGDYLLAGAARRITVDGAVVVAGEGPVHLEAGRHLAVADAPFELRSDPVATGPDPWSLPGLAVARRPGSGR